MDDNSNSQIALRKIVSLTGITKRFPGVTALKAVDFDVHEGESHVLFGENGSGKSTLANIIAGTYARDEGEFHYRGESITSLTPHQARLMGISPVFQDFSLVPDMTVEENLFLGRERTSRIALEKRKMHIEGTRIMERLGFLLPLRTVVRKLSRADQQMTEIAKALLQEVKLLILDEPTSSLTERECEKLFDIIEKLKRGGVGIIYISHRMAEIRRIGDRVTILRNGERIGTVGTTDITDTELVEMMTGYRVGHMFPQIRHNPGKVALEVKNLTIEKQIADISIAIRSGQITGIAGLAGGGKSTIPRAIFGLEKIASGEILHLGERILGPDPAKMLARGIFYLPSDRAAESLALPRPLRENASMASLEMPKFSKRRILLRRNEREYVTELARKLAIRPLNIEMEIRLFSGGNQQKIVILRALSRSIDVFLLDDPTVGIDVGAKREVYSLMKELVENGAAVLFVSSELPELLNLSHTLYVVHRGILAAELRGEDISERRVLSIFFESKLS